MNVRKLVLFLITLCLIPWALMAAWVWLNVTVAATPPWQDALFGVVIILWMMLWAGPLAARLAQRRAGRWGSWLFLILAALTGVLYASLDLPEHYFYHFPLNWLARILRWPLRLLIIPGNLILQLRRVY